MKHLFFDLDGTLADSSPGILYSFTETFKELNIPVPPRQDMLPFIGPPLEYSFGQFGDANFVELAVATYRKHYKAIGVKRSQLYPGISDLLEQLKKDGYVLAVATSKHEPMALEMLKNLKVLDYFDGVFGSLGDDTKADVLARGLQTLHSPKEQSYMIGDTHFDMVGGKTCGVHTIGVTWGFGSADSLLEAGADILLDTPKDIQNHLSKD